MIEWPWSKVERDVYSQFEASEDKIKKQLKNAESRLKVEVESLSGKLVSIVSEMEAQLTQERATIIRRIEEINSNISSLHKNATDQNNALIDLKKRIVSIESLAHESSFFSEKKPLKVRSCSLMSKLKDAFLGNHLLIVSHLFFILSTAALTWLVISNM